MNFEERYGRLDRLLHDIAFWTGRAQHALAEVEEILHRATLAEIALEAPVFITALPRSGTTILLRLLYDTGHFAAHTYRDMPFVLCPMLWRRFTDRFGVEGRPTERAHGDGIEISATSPEAFEEMVWKRFWPDHYRDDRIVPWSGEEDRPAFDEFFRTHMRKIIALRGHDPADRRRYLSKNNVNVARLAARPSALAEGTLLIPFREPIQHAASLLRQHERFTRIHERDDFVRRYMAGIGHHEFGQTLRPIDFGGWLEGAPPPDALSFWARYWIAAYDFVLEHLDDRARLISYRRLTEEPEAALADLAEAIGLPRAALTARAERLHPPRRHDVSARRLPGKIREEATALYGRLQARADL